MRNLDDFVELQFGYVAVLVRELLILLRDQVVLRLQLQFLLSVILAPVSRLEANGDRELGRLHLRRRQLLLIISVLNHLQSLLLLLLLSFSPLLLLEFLGLPIQSILLPLPFPLLCSLLLQQLLLSLIQIECLDLGQPLLPLVLVLDVFHLQLVKIVPDLFHFPLLEQASYFARAHALVDHALSLVELTSLSLFEGVVVTVEEQRSEVEYFGLGGVLLRWFLEQFQLIRVFGGEILESYSTLTDIVLLIWTLVMTILASINAIVVVLISFEIDFIAALEEVVAEVGFERTWLWLIFFALYLRQFL